MCQKLTSNSTTTYELLNQEVLGRYHGKGWLLTALYSAPLLIFIGIQNQSRVYGKNPSTWEYKADPEYLTHGVSMYQREKDNKLDLF